ncbi:MAG: hypothetical protein NVS2B17_26440 [Candidatus Velthaea sp.]
MVKVVDARPLDATHAAMRMLAERGQKPRFAMRGESMRPTLREPMVLELGPPAPLRVGDIIVFAASVLTAHRIIAIETDAVRTSGDATPEIVERVPLHRIIGTVAGIRASDQPCAPRLEHSASARLARAFVFVRRARAVSRRVRTFALLPFRSRTQPFRALLEALHSAETGDTARIGAALALTTAYRLIPTARRHRCAGLLVDAIRASGTVEPRYAELKHGLMRSKYSAALHASAYMRDIDAAVRVLNASEVRFVLLKGAARAFVDAAAAAETVSVDIDILVDRAEADRAFAAFIAAGYRAQHNEADAALFRRRHYHLSPLFPPGDGAPIEIHVALAPRDRFTTRLDAPALAPFVETIERGGQRAAVLGPESTLIHLLFHTIGVAPLRDIVLAARIWRRLDEPARDRVRSIIARERREGLRMRANLFLTEWFAGSERAPDSQVARYISWVVMREQLPHALRVRAELADGIAARAPLSAIRGNGARARFRTLPRLCAVAAAIVLDGLFGRFIRRDAATTDILPRRNV